MKEKIIQHFDQKINVLSAVDLNVYEYFEEADNADLSLVLVRDKHASAAVFKNNLLFYRHRYINIHLVRHLASYIVNDRSCVYNSMHASGFVVDGRGVIATGNRNSGKSTVANMFDAKVLDDDLLIVDSNTMYVTGKMGSITVVEGGEKKLRYFRDDAVKEHGVNLVLLLNRSHNRVLERDCIPRDFSVHDNLHPALIERYTAMSPISFNAPIYEVGTADAPDVTKKRLECLVLNEKL